MIELFTDSNNRLYGRVELKAKKPNIVDISSILTLNEDVEIFLEPIIFYANGRAARTQSNWLAYISDLGKAFIALKVDRLPTEHEEWQSLVVKVHAHWLSNPDSGSSLSTRLVDWAHAVKLLRVLQDASDVIPVGVRFPGGEQDGLDLSPYGDELIGQSAAEVVTGEIDKLLVSISLSIKDAAYLEDVRDGLIHRRGALKAVSLKWCATLKQNFLYGQRLLNQVNIAQLETELANNTVKRVGALGPPASEERLANLLALCHHRYAGNCSRRLFSGDVDLPSQILALPPSAPPVPSSLITPYQQVNWMLGNLSPLDVAYALVFLAIQLPNFPIGSLLHAQIKDENGRSYFEPSSKGITFRVEKPRAKSMKQHELDSDSIEIIQTLIDMTRSQRAKLIDEKSHAASYLFLTWTFGLSKLASYSSIIAFVTGNTPSCNWIGDYTPELLSAGMERGTITFKKIRATEGVLEWFRTGSPLAASRILGNTVRIALTYYIPRALLNAWYVRLARRYQNLILCLSATNESFLLEVTDFHSLEQLHAFIADMLNLHPPGSNFLADELHKHFANVMPQPSSEKQDGEGRIAVPISAHMLAVLFHYRDCVFEAGTTAFELDTPKEGSRIEPRALVDLAELLTHRLPNHPNPEFRDACVKALAMLPEMKIRHKWGHLLHQVEVLS